jgi:hypothetical protein
MEEIPSYNGSAECEHCELIAGWIIGRCLFQDSKNRTIKFKLIRELVREHTHMSNSMLLPGFWGRIVEIAVWGELAESVVQEYCQAIDRAWLKLRYILEPGADLKVIMDSNVDSWIELDKLMVKSHSLIVGNAVRRAMVGVLSIQIERTYVAMFQRTIDGAIQYSVQQNGQ